MPVEDKDFQLVITNITAVLYNYLRVAKQSGTVTINVSAVNGNVTGVEVINRLILDVSRLDTDGEDAPSP